MEWEGDSMDMMSEFIVIDMLMYTSAGGYTSAEKGRREETNDSAEREGKGK